MENDLNSSGFSILRVDGGSLSKPARKLIKCISNAIGGLYEPKGIVRRARAEMQARLIKAEADIAVSELQRRAARRSIVQEARYQENFEKIIQDALPHLKDEAKPEKVSADWYVNFFDKARLISDGEMQSLWSKILAGEANHPGHFSRRTVNFVDSLDKREAHLFTTLCGFNVSFTEADIPLVIDDSNDIYQSNGINFIGLSLLDSIGLINFEGLTGFAVKDYQGKVCFSYYGKSYTMELVESSARGVAMGSVMLTGIGQELAPFCGSEPVPGFEEHMLRYWQDYSPMALD